MSNTKENQSFLPKVPNNKVSAVTCQLTTLTLTSFSSLTIPVWTCLNYLPTLSDFSITHPVVGFWILVDLVLDLTVLLYACLLMDLSRNSCVRRPFLEFCGGTQVPPFLNCECLCCFAIWLYSAFIYLVDMLLHCNFVCGYLCSCCHCRTYL